jgi:hypothetical protein
MGWADGDDHHGVRADDIGRLTHRHRKIIASDPLPRAGEERDSDKRTMGVVSMIAGTS